MADETPVCHNTMLGEGCGHPVADHVEPTPNGECCCCTRLQNEMSHVDGCLDCAIKHAKRQCRVRGISKTPTTVEVEPFIAEALRPAFWERYVGKYFDGKRSERAAAWGQARRVRGRQLMRTVREAPHRCDPGYPRGNGEIIQCDCGRYWIARTYPNEAYDRWARLTWIGRKLRGLS